VQEFAMNLLKTTPLAAAVLASLLVGCQRREATPPGDTEPGTTASAPGTGSPGTMGETPGTTPPALPASPASPASPTGSTDGSLPAGVGTAGGLGGAGTETGTTTGTAATAPNAGSAALPGAAGPLNTAEKTFVTKAAAGGLYEVEIAKLAADKATDPAVKSFATMLVDHHSAANAELKALAAMRDVKLPDEVPPDKKQVIDKLRNQSGAGFDREFVQQVGIKDHEQDIKLFQDASRDAKDEQLKSWIDKTLPTLKEHLAAAQKLPGSKTAGSS
jgi:putative membrane protein